MKLLNIITKIRSRIKRMYYYNKSIIKLKCNEVIYESPISVNEEFILRKHKDSVFKIGRNCMICSGGGVNALLSNLKCTILINRKAKLVIGDNVQISARCIWTEKSIIIGNNVKIGGDVMIMDSDAHSLNYTARRYFDTDINDTISSPIIIGDDVLIGARSIILKGVEIGARSIIGSGSVVTKSIPQDCIAAGNPCRIIKVINDENNSSHNCL